MLTEAELCGKRTRREMHRRGLRIRSWLRVKHREDSEREVTRRRLWVPPTAKVRKASETSLLSKLRGMFKGGPKARQGGI